MMKNNALHISGQIVDLVHSRIFQGTLTVESGKIIEIKEEPTAEKQYIMPGFIDAHVHIESSMLPPSEFARLAVCHGTVATVSDPHEIANVLGIEGIRYMIHNGEKVPFKFFFGAPSCVPATAFETSGDTVDALAVDELMGMKSIYFLSEMMNYPGVLSDDPEILKKLEAAKHNNKPVDGHAPTLRGEPLKKYVEAGINTDHECFSTDEAEEKIGLGMKILIREGSAAKNYEALIPLMNKYPEMLMFCSDDKHPNELVEGHINKLVRMAIRDGYDSMDVLRAASLNVLKHYNLKVGMLQQGDDADFIVVDNLSDLNILKTFIKGELVAENGVSRIPHLHERPLNHFNALPLKEADLHVDYPNRPIKVMCCEEGSLVTKTEIMEPKVEKGNMISDTSRDVLKIVVYNRYSKAVPAIAFIKGFGLKQGALASSVAHDSHNIVAVGCSDSDIIQAINALIITKGGIVACNGNQEVMLPLPIAGLMSLDDGYVVAQTYERANVFAHELGTSLTAPFMTLAFMSLLVIPELKLSDKGLFDTTRFCFTTM